jgi:hypothetical protein
LDALFVFLIVLYTAEANKKAVDLMERCSLTFKLQDLIAYGHVNPQRADVYFYKKCVAQWLFYEFLTQRKIYQV